MNKDEWSMLPDMTAVAVAKEKGWEIEVNHLCEEDWAKWSGEYWCIDDQFRGRPAQPKTRTLTIHCYYTGNGLVWSEVASPDWVRISSEDKAIEVPE